MTALLVRAAGADEQDPDRAVPVAGKPVAGAERGERDAGWAEIRGWAGANLTSVQWW